MSSSEGSFNIENTKDGIEIRININSKKENEETVEKQETLQSISKINNIEYQAREIANSIWDFDRFVKDYGVNVENTSVMPIFISKSKNPCSPHSKYIYIWRNCKKITDQFKKHRQNVWAAHDADDTEEIVKKMFGEDANVKDHSKERCRTFFESEEHLVEYLLENCF